ncbi:GNAT family N-acetyltransferase [Streptomyces sp. NBC_00257]|uniref:GNAT family N-acetyltransferase n=1 Tax=unclassified Streptomyces TaxID=2593676 RepID=UPI0022559041|nr:MULTISPECIES: GNAT family N-acetyltransferase [unclassified Streptomyces]WTB58129.1 GNAT family N-acetyltransferase [Streptomyces sp. NBC_00826]WTH88991.1 GNAT family N-acetyltransferase [Streptomyces sp. NBC_00825]WTH97721.1 GNAT family N-acetyltransferase [Streptomyces sp. NBC_00822]MCX4863247.1 GNAT family N-acetyltransferase [Streptomyces sp. NBC_00906]MCX4894484.1 GNAT family N-acetyltransferase [Streptomyces sp. NBC_00892]
MNPGQEALLALFDREMREHARPDAPGGRVERTGDVVRQVGAADDWNGVVWSDPDLDPARADVVIAEQVAYYTALGHDEFEWKLYAHDRPADLAQRLPAAGFEAEEPETLLVAPVAELSTQVALPDGVRLRTVRDADDVELMARAHERAFGSDWSRLRHQVLTRLAEDPDGFVGVLAMVGDEPVSSARMELYPGTGFAGLWGGGTVEAWRGKGIYRALVAFRARIAAERGYGYLQVDASDMSAPILRRLGFLALSTTTPYVYRSR